MCRDGKQIIILVFRTKRSKWGLRELGVTIWRYLHKLIILATVNIIIGLHHQQHNHHMSPVWQRSPVVPFGQSQTNGFVHFPPFKQDGWQNAEDDHTYKLGCFYKAFRLMCVSAWWKPTSLTQDTSISWQTSTHIRANTTGAVSEKK